MVVIVLIGALIGLSLPFIFTKLDRDPAAASGPLVTSLTDVLGVLAYFGIASDPADAAAGVRPRRRRLAIVRGRS
jgi:Mg/Co/Ni transporter MgtE